MRARYQARVALRPSRQGRRPRDAAHARVLRRRASTAGRTQTEATATESAAVGNSVSAAAGNAITQSFTVRWRRRQRSKLCLHRRLLDRWQGCHCSPSAALLACWVPCVARAQVSDVFGNSTFTGPPNVLTRYAGAQASAVAFGRSYYYSQPGARASRCGAQRAACPQPPAPRPRTRRPCPSRRREPGGRQHAGQRGQVSFWRTELPAVRLAFGAQGSHVLCGRGAGRTRRAPAAGSTRTRRVRCSPARAGRRWRRLARCAALVCGGAWPWVRSGAAGCARAHTVARCCFFRAGQPGLGRRRLIEL